jgi:hypothetical protein
MENHLEKAIRELRMAESQILYAVEALEREIKVPVVDSEASRRRNNDLIEAIENCHLELMRKVRLRRRLLTIVLGRYTFGPTENDSPAEAEKPIKKAARKTRAARC